MLGSVALLGSMAVAEGPAAQRAVVPVLSMIAKGTFLFPEKGRLPYGVLISAYSHDRKTFGRLLSEAHDAARSVRAADRQPPPTALITHRPELAQSDAFDMVVPVRPDLHFAGAYRNEGYSPQWMTRLYYYASSPFNVTLAMDSNAGVCRPVWPLLLEMRQWDFAVPNQLRDCPPKALWPHNFAMAYSMGPRTERLFEQWLLTQLRVGVPVDDQKTLIAAIHLTVGVLREQAPPAALRVGVLAPRAALSLITLDTTTFTHFLPAATPMIRGSVMLVHPFQHMSGGGSRGRDKNMGSCAAWNAGAGTLRTSPRGGGGRPSADNPPRVLVAFVNETSDGAKAVRFEPAASGAECRRLANETCEPRIKCRKGWSSWPFTQPLPDRADAAERRLVMPLFGDEARRKPEQRRAQGAGPDRAGRKRADKKGAVRSVLVELRRLRAAVG